MISGSKTKDKILWRHGNTFIPRNKYALSRNSSFESKKNQVTLLHNAHSIWLKRWPLHFAFAKYLDTSCPDSGLWLFPQSMKADGGMVLRISPPPLPPTSSSTQYSLIILRFNATYFHLPTALLNKPKINTQINQSVETVFEVEWVSIFARCLVSTPFHNAAFRPSQG